MSLKRAKMDCSHTKSVLGKRYIAHVIQMTKCPVQSPKLTLRYNAAALLAFEGFSELLTKSKVSARTAGLHELSCVNATATIRCHAVSRDFA